MWKEAITDYFKELPQYLTGGVEEHHERYDSQQLTSTTRLEHVAPTLRSKSYKCWTATYCKFYNVHCRLPELTEVQNK
jgi:hypothetical protein